MESLRCLIASVYDFAVFQDSVCTKIESDSLSSGFLSVVSQLKALNFFVLLLWLLAIVPFFMMLLRQMLSFCNTAGSVLIWVGLVWLKCVCDVILVLLHLLLLPVNELTNLLFVFFISVSSSSSFLLSVLLLLLLMLLVILLVYEGSWSMSYRSNGAARRQRKIWN